jgi:hypothetical protein
MRVSKRYATLASAVAAAFLSSAASAGNPDPTPVSPAPPSHCCTHPGGPTINVPGVHIGGPSVHVGGPNINIGGVNVNSSVNVNVQANASASAMARASAINNSSTVVYGGGTWMPPVSRGGGGAAIAGLRLAGEYEQVEEERSRYVEGWRVVRAVCLDDTGTPHPASRPDPDERVPREFDGEIYRCMAGTWMQTSIGWREEGVDRFEDGQTLVCEKGEALRHAPGGRLYCATEEPRRNCNERSLLRRYGPGIKLVYYRYEETYTETVERRSERVSTQSMTIMLDGGVGSY